MRNRLVLNINSGSVSRFTTNLETISRRSVPFAIRNALNNTAFDMKKYTLHQSVKENFDGLKAPQFFKRYSGVERAKGIDINRLKATVGLIDMGNAAARKAVENMDKQEKGGTINEGFAYLKGARGANSLNRFVRRENYYNKTNTISARSGSAKGTNKSRFVGRAAVAYKENKPMFINSSKGNFLAKVTKFSKTKRGKVRIKTKLLMMERGSVRIKATHFMKEAAVESQKKMEQFYIQEVNKQLQRIRQ